jgi:hypothetical protein
MRTDFEQRLINIILQDKYADTKMEQTKQAFIDEGWLDTKQLGGLKSTNIATPSGERVDFMIEAEWEAKAIKDGWVNTKSVGFEGFTVSNLMTGQAWLERFEKEVDAMGMEPPIVDGAYLDAAKKAAGIDS